MLIGWKTQKQGVVALLTAEAEFVEPASGAKEILGVRQLSEEIGLAVLLLMTMAMDNQASNKQVANESSSAQAKRVDVKLKFMWDLQFKRLYNLNISARRIWKRTSLQSPSQRRALRSFGT